MVGFKTRSRTLQTVLLKHARIALPRFPNSVLKFILGGILSDVIFDCVISALVSRFRMSVPVNGAQKTRVFALNGIFD